MKGLGDKERGGMMKKTIKYANIETIKYEFTLVDIRRALVNEFKIPKGDTAVLELYEETGGEPQFAELIITFKHDEE